MIPAILLTVICVHLTVTLHSQTPDPGPVSVVDSRQWPSYRGYYASGILDGTNLPDSFDVENGYNIRWVRDIPGLGLSCPVIWGNTVFITSAVSQSDNKGFRTGIYGDIEPVQDSSEHAWMVYCMDKETGETVWEREAHRGVPRVKRHPKSTHANTTVATDGIHVIAFFGSEGIYCYSMQGELLWNRDLGLIRSAWSVVESAEWEFCSSPVIFGDKVIIQVDALNTAFVAVLDIATGSTLWKRERDEISGWSSPNVYMAGNRPVVVVNGYRHRGGYDLETGEEVWRMAGGGDIPIPTPVVWRDYIFFNSAHGRHSPLMAVKKSAKGNIPYPGNGSLPEDVAWFHERGGAYMSSVLVYDSLLYQLRWNGNLSCYEPHTGELIYQETVNPSSFIASPVASDQRIYMVSENGDVYIARTGRTFEILKKISLGEPSLVSPGIAENMIVFRTAGKLIAVSDIQ